MTETSVVLPGSDYVVHQWKANDGCFVNKGECILFFRHKNVTADDVVIKTHLRPRVKSRKSIVVDDSDSRVRVNESSMVMSLLSPVSGILRKSIITDSITSSLVLGFIEQCTHPAVLDSLCAVCGASMIASENDLPKAYIHPGTEQPFMSQITVSGGVTMRISKSEALSVTHSQTERLVKHKKLSLVLDLDHTLVHATSDTRASLFETREDVRTLLLPAENGAVMHHWVKLRPHIKEFLDQPHYEISVYTAGTRLYAEQITMVLSRFMVGAKLDHIDLLQLKKRLNEAEIQLEKVPQNERRDDELAIDEDLIKDSCSSPLKKRVRFGEPLSSIQSDENTMTSKKLETLKSNWRAAEDKENEALELRQKIFGSRIFSRTDVGDLGRDVKSLKRIFPCGGTMSVIVDDREDVWANAQENSREPPSNLLVVRPYHWQPFAGFADVNNSAGIDLTKSSDLKRSSDTKNEIDMQLRWTKDILLRVHHSYYFNNGKMTASEIIRDMRLSTLHGCTVVFSGLIPLHKQRDDYDGPAHPLIRYAQSMGAKVMAQVENSLTHVVAAADGSEKVLQARQIPGCHIVTSSWLMECIWTLTKRPESDHLLQCNRLMTFNAATLSNSNKNSILANESNSSRLSSTDEDEDENEDFADELWEE
jgi:RNA polymerase II subunit A C-terminal domain phosphatase